MARDFSKVSPAFWRSKKFRQLPTDQSRLAYVYMLTCEHQTSAGAYRLPHAYAADDLGWPIDTFKTGLAQVEEAGLIISDNETDEILITNWFKHNRPMNRKHRIGIVAILERLESNELHEYGISSLELVSPDPDKVSDEDSTDGNALEYHPPDFSRSALDDAIKRKNGVCHR